MNLRAKFDAASFILAGDIRNSTNTKSKQTKNQTQTNKVNDISTPCLLARVDKKVLHTQRHTNVKAIFRLASHQSSFFHLF